MMGKMQRPRAEGEEVVRKCSGIAQKNREQRGVGEIAEKTIVRVEGKVKVRQREKWSSEANKVAEGDRAMERGDERVR
jgi:hypothetical protein